MYKIGDYVAHCKEGICEVVNVGKLNMSCSDREKEYYTLKPLYHMGGVLYTPVANERGQIRDVITAEEARLVVADMSNIEELQIEDEKKREDVYKKEMLKNQCRSWIAVMKTSYLRKMRRISSGKKVINIDDKYLSIAEGFLYGELSVALAMTKEEVKEYVIGSIK